MTTDLILMSEQEVTTDRLLQRHGPVVSRVLERQFPSFSVELCERLTVEAIARVWRHLQRTGQTHLSDAVLFTVILKTARHRAIDLLRREPTFHSLDPRTLNDTVAVEGPAEKSIEKLMQEADLQTGLERLTDTERRVLTASVNPPLSGHWARDLAIQLLQEETSGQSSGTEVAEGEIERCSARLRVQRIRAIKKLKAYFHDKGYDVPDGGT